MFSRNTLEADDIKRVVVRGTNWVGDAVMTIPALRELRRVLPNAQITLVTRSSTRALFDEADFIDDILTYDRIHSGARALFSQMREWRRRKFDLAVLLQNAFEAALIAFVGGVPTRIGYATQGRRAFLSHPLAVPTWHGSRHEVFYYLNIVAELEKVLRLDPQAMPREPVFDLKAPIAQQRNARELLIANGARPDRRLIALCPGSTNSRAKRWPAERYAALADKLIEEMDADVVLIGSSDEMEVSNTVLSLMKQKPLVLTGRTNLGEAVAVLSLADILITNDTGPAHISAALDRPTLVIFGPTDPTTTRPFSSDAEIIRHQPDCAPCMLRDCPIDHRCMTAISPDEVFSRVQELISQHRVGVEA